METGLYLTGMVFAVGALHLLNRLVTYVSRLYAASARSAKAPVHRDDWYVFFHRSALTGKSREKKPAARDDKRSVASRGNTKRSDSRPALRQYSA